MESDFLLMVIRDLLHRRPALKLVLMSATLDVDLFARYFRTKAAPSPPKIKMAGRAFPVLQVRLPPSLRHSGVPPPILSVVHPLPSRCCSSTSRTRSSSRSTR